MTAPNKPVAKLRRVRLEVGTGAPGYRWIEGYQVITPDGLEVFPYMTKTDARDFVRKQGWQAVVEAF